MQFPDQMYTMNQINATFSCINSYFLQSLYNPIAMKMNCHFTEYLCNRAYTL